ncbi:sulfatase-like hydrolase/transferase [Ahrensia kielensis]|uniref:Sulfatase-like hydrolase/transferase n=1 Tax=Ahrensia kielensis TaxID=76980 RepID=A0ABU9T1H0_9HYPH
MSAKPRNLLFILSDEHNRDISGCYGHPFVKTPNIDRLASKGTRFTSGYCNSPICVPSRASLATGKYAHETGCWDNAHPFDGSHKSWHAALREKAVDVTSIGKLHYRSEEDDNGFTQSILPVHVIEGKGDLKGLFRKDLSPKKDGSGLAKGAGVGTSDYWRYDTSITQSSKKWLAERAKSGSEEPFVLFVSLVLPHFPLIAEQEYYDLYKDLDLETLSQGLTAPATEHPTIRRMAEYLNYNDHFDDASKAVAMRCYFAMVTRLDDMIGELLLELETSGLSETTDVIYTSDHGECLGNREFWGKSNMYEESAGIPLIFAGHNVPQGAVIDTPVSLIDIAPTAAAVTGADVAGENYRGTSLVDLANGGDSDRVVFSEYHATGSNTGIFMVRKGAWKYVYYVDAPCQLFHLKSDPQELTDLSKDPAFDDIRKALDTELRAICDPEKVNAQAFADQARTVELNGGRDKVLQVKELAFTPAPTA